MEDALKANVDASFHQHTSSAFSGVIIRNFEGSVVSGLSRKHKTCYALTAEALALRDAMNLASNLLIDKVVFESDCLELVQSCRGEIQRGEISGIMQDVQHLKRNFLKCDFTWTARAGNVVAHQIAALVRRDLLSSDWIFNQPLVVKQQLERDKEHAALRRPNVSNQNGAL